MLLHRLRAYLGVLFFVCVLHEHLPHLGAPDVLVRRPLLLEVLEATWLPIFESRHSLKFLDRPYIQ